MNTSPQSLFRWFGVLTIIWHPSLVLAQEPDPRLAWIFADWDRRRDRSAVARYLVTGEKTYLKGATDDPMAVLPADRHLPDRDVSVHKRFELLLDFRNNRHRVAYDREDYVFPKGPVFRETGVSVFDGSLRKGLDTTQAEQRMRFEKPHPDLWIVKGKHENVYSFVNVSVVFFGHGVIADLAKQRVYPGNLRPRPDEKIFRVEREQDHEGKRCVILRTPPTGATHDEYWIDPDRESAIVRVRNHDGDSVTGDLVVAYQAAEGLWMPERWTYTNYEVNFETIDGDRPVYRPTFFIDMVVERMTFDKEAAASEFAVEARPGMLVGVADDSIAPRSRFFRVAANGDWRPVSERDAEVIPRSGRWPWFVIGVLPLLIAGPVMSWTRRRKRPAKGAA